MEFDFLDDLKVGDKVYVVYPGNWSRRYEEKIVEKVTATQVQVSGCSQRFRKKNGYQMGEHYSSTPYLVQFTEELKRNLALKKEHQNLVSSVKSFDSWKSLSLEELRSIKMIIDNRNQ